MSKTKKPPVEKPPPTIGYVILAALFHLERTTGYELSQLMGPPRNFMWEAKHSQVYPTLDLLTQLKYVKFSSVRQSKKPDKKVYRITAKGIAALRAWAKRGPTHVPVKDEFSMRMAVLCTLPPEEAATVLRWQIEQVQQEIDTIEAHIVDFRRRYRLPEPAPPTHKEYGLYCAICHSRDVKELAVKRYRRILEEMKAAPSTPRSA
jgi:DNA-binding PadR family transcriptional regulator